MNRYVCSPRSVCDDNRELLSHDVGQVLLHSISQFVLDQEPHLILEGEHVLDLLNAPVNAIFEQRIYAFVNHVFEELIKMLVDLVFLKEGIYACIEKSVQPLPKTVIHFVLQSFKQRRSQCLHQPFYQIVISGHGHLGFLLYARLEGSKPLLKTVEPIKQEPIFGWCAVTQSQLLSEYVQLEAELLQRWIWCPGGQGMCPR